MNWTKVSAISDIVVAISVIVSLAYVANQLEQNTKALQQTAAINVTQVWMGQQSLLAEDGELNDIFWRGMNADTEMPKTDQMRFEAFLSGWVQAFQQSFILQESGVLDNDLWQNQLRSMRWVFSNKGAVNHWQKWKSAHMPSFVSFVDSHVIDEQ